MPKGVDVQSFHNFKKKFFTKFHKGSGFVFNLAVFLIVDLIDLADLVIIEPILSS
jgi:hypothetical protein